MRSAQGTGVTTGTARTTDNLQSASNASDWVHPTRKIALVKPGGKKYVFLSGDSFVIADQTPAHTMENVGKGYAVMLVNAVAAQGLETVVMAKP